MINPSIEEINLGGSAAQNMDSSVPAALSDDHSMELAIVGLAGRFPGAASVDEFWHNLKNGVESISFFTDEEVEAAGVELRQLKDPHYVKAGGILNDAEYFDANFFSVYPREAAIMDPQQRVFLEVAWEALENAGYNPELFPGWIGLFAGTGMNTYLLFNLLPNREIMDTVHGYQLTISSDKDFLPTRVSYKLNLRGPSINVQTACSTSLVAVHLACQSLLSYQCDMALAGGVSIRQPQKTGYLYQEGGITSPDGHCRAFDARAAGTVYGNGAGVVVIKRLADALEHGDSIRAIIKGSAINNDGSLKVGYTAPSIEGQAEVISMAQAVAGVDPATISYIETHGTGTALGDPIEIAALTQVFQASTEAKQFCGIGSVKTNIGHLDAAAGVASLIKATLALENRQLPPSLHFTRPNPKIDFENSPFYVNTELRDWESDGAPRRAGVSSFGIGGTNVHLILEEANPVKNPDLADGLVSTANQQPHRPWELILLSARSASALEKATDNLAGYLVDHADIPLADSAYTLQVGRKAFSQRRMLVCKDLPEAIEALKSRDLTRVFSDAQHENGGKRHPQMVFMFSGQGAQYVNMARELYASEPVFKRHVDQCADFLVRHLGKDIRELIFVDSPLAAESAENTGTDPATQALTQTAITQPALFVIEYALARLLIGWGIHPQAMIGHSIGEYVAACLAGVFSLDDALALVAARGRVMQSVAPGAMLSIPLSEAEVQPYLDSGLSLSAVNAPSLCVVSGEFYRIEALINRLANDGVEYRRLRTSHAFHSSMMDPILEEFRHQFVGIELSAPSIPIISNVTGAWITEQQATDPEYWVRHLRQTVRFSDGISELLRDPAWTLLEVGPGQTLATLAKSVLAAWADSGSQEVDDRVILTTVRPVRSTQADQAFLLTTLGRLWMTGVEIDWEAYHHGDEAAPRRHRVALPTYPFERKLYWVEPDQPLYQLLAGTQPAENTQAGFKSRSIFRPPAKRAQVADWFYSPSWKRSDLPAIANESTGAGSKPASQARWLIFEDSAFGAPMAFDLSLGQAVEAACEKYADASVLVRVWPGESFQKLSPPVLEKSDQPVRLDYQINPDQPETYEVLLKDLVDQDCLPDYLVYLWGDHSSFDPEQVNAGFGTLLSLVQAFEKGQITRQTRLAVITNGASEVTGEDVVHPEQAGLIALCRVISQEYPNLTCHSIDLMQNGLMSGNAKAATWIVAELLHEPDDRFVAYRGNHRWVEVYEPLALKPEKRTGGMGGGNSVPGILQPGGVYLITGGLGRIGLTLAEYLARSVQAKLLLVDRFEFPARAEWPALAGDPTNPHSQRINRLLGLETLGAQTLVVQTDVADRASMQAALDLAIGRFGTLNGIIHAAGIVGEAAIKPMAETRPADVDTQFNPKVAGLQVLHELVGELPHSNELDFVFLQSSLSAVLGGLGLGAYAAANATMDSFAQLFNAEEPDYFRTEQGLENLAWISVNWDGWSFSEPTRELTSSTTIAELTMTPAEGIQAFELALAYAAKGARRLIISTADLDARIEQWIRMSTAAQPGAPGAAEADGLPETTATVKRSGSFARPNLQTTYVAPRNALESQLVEVWQKVLGIVPVGVHDDFFELGGHSLLATQLVTRLRDMFRVELPLRRLFEGPTIAGLAELIAAGSENSAATQTMEAATPGVTRISRQGDLPLSFGQQRLWFIDQFEPGSALYNNFAALRLSGELNRAAFEYSIRKIIERHESLRTTFSEQRGQPVQVIHESMPVPLELLDLESIPAEQLQDEINRLAMAEARRPFDLQIGPLFRIVLVQLDSPATEHVVFMTMHHIVSDGWSVGVIIREIAAFYRSYIQNDTGESPLPELAIQYVDYAAWQRDTLQGKRLQDQLDYWKDKLADSQQLELFTDYPRPAVQSSRGANIWFELPERLSADLAVFSQHEGVTLFMTLLAALQTLLARYTGQDDISVGTPIANRTQAEVENLIGFVLNTLVMRTDFSGNPSFREGLRRVKETALGAYGHQDLPFEMLVEAVQPVRDMSRSPLFQVIFDLQSAPLQSLNLPGLTISPIRIDSRTAKFDLALSLEESTTLSASGQKRTKIGGYLNYNTDLFEPQTIEHLLEHFQVLLAGIVANPETPVWQLPLLTPAEKDQLSAGWGFSLRPASGEDEFPAPLIHEMIRRQALQTPSAKALSLARKDSQSLTYGELDRLTDQVARRLIDLGVKPETLVGLCMDRSLEMIIGLLGILKSGGAFLPLDPTYPKDRLAYMLADSQAPVVLTQAALLEANPVVASLFGQALQPAVQVVCIEDVLAALENEPAQQSMPVGSDVNVTGDNLAYVIYTSGSTGKPKGVMITHQAIADHCRDMRRHFETQPGDRVLQFASLNFDAGLEQVFVTLLAGAWLFVRDNDVWPAEEFHAKINDLGLTVVNVPPAYWHPWVLYVAELEAKNQPVDSGDVYRSVPGLRLVIIGGDVMLTDTLQVWWRTSLRNVRLLNAYGPTETVITASTYQAPERPVETLAGSHYARIPIGRLHPHRTGYILDKAGNLTPPGVPGELHLGGAYLARGYLHQPELTNEKFIPNPFGVRSASGQNERVYRTGDLVRSLPDGTLDIIGRIDQQVKLRGFRIELGEIEAVISAHPQVDDAAVVIQADPGGDKRLVAYLVLSAGVELDAGEFYAYVSGQLPAYMTPGAFVQIASLPLSPSGKVNRQALAALPLPEAELAARKKRVTAPRSPLEQEILEMWVDVLKIPRSSEGLAFGVDDNFFELGGHSLLATQIVSRLRETYQVDLPLRELFENPTVSGITALIAQSLVDEEDDEDLDALLAELELMSDEDARQMLDSEPTQLNPGRMDDPANDSGVVSDGK